MNVDINELLLNYGYLVLFFGCLLEGETVVLLAGIAVHQGILTFWNAVLTAMAGGILGDQILFLVGYFSREKVQKYVEKHKDKIEKVNRFIIHRPLLSVMGVRFMYGFRIIGPIIIGASRLNPIKFFLINVFSAFVWALIFSTLGYFAGELFIKWMHHLHDHVKFLIWIVAALVIAKIIHTTLRRFFFRNSR